MATSNPAAGFQWSIGPINGSSELANGMPLYGTIIGLHYKGQPLIGVIDHPNLIHAVMELMVLEHFVLVNGSFLDDFNTQAFDGTERVATATRSNFMRYGDEAQIFDTFVQRIPTFEFTFAAIFIHVPLPKRWTPPLN